MEETKIIVEIPYLKNDRLQVKLVEVTRDMLMQLRGKKIKLVAKSDTSFEVAWDYQYSLVEDVKVFAKGLRVETTLEDILNIKL